VTALAIIRPSDWELPLFVHVLGAFTLIGALVLAASYLFAGRGGSLAMTRLGFRSLLMAALPAYIVLRVGAEWVASEEDLSDSDASWIEVGYISADLGLLVLLGATLAAGLAVRRAGRAAPAEGGGGAGVSIAAWLVSALIVVYGVVIWMMATQPN
jgi:hypothetical protein